MIRFADKLDNTESTELPDLSNYKEIKPVLKTTDDKVMHDFLFDIINHENENSQYSKEYTKLIDKAIEERRKHAI